MTTRDAQREFLYALSQAALGGAIVHRLADVLQAEVTDETRAGVVETCRMVAAGEITAEHGVHSLVHHLSQRAARRISKEVLA